MAAVTDEIRAVEIKRILALKTAGCSSMFSYLGVDADTATMDTIKKAYRRLALCTHSDKTSLEGASEAFALIERAFKSFPSEAVLERFKQAEAKKRQAAPAVAAASEEDQEKAHLEIVREAHQKAVREMEQRDRRRQREEEEAEAKAQQAKEILQHHDEWKKFRGMTAASSKKQQ